jgi:hypothetical protein
MRVEKTRKIIAVSITLLCIISTIHAFGNRHSQWHRSRKENMLSKRMYSSPLDIKSIYKGLELIPEDASVSATNTIAPHLAYRSNIYVFPEIRDAEYIALLDDGNPFPIGQELFEKLRDDYLNNKDWSLIYNKGEFMLFRKTDITH